MVPDTHYVTTGGVSIAYQVSGSGPIDLVVVPGWLSNIEIFWEEPRVARFFQKLGTFSRVILFDKRGTGLSDRSIEAATLEERMDDVRAVMDAVGSSRAALFGYSEGATMCTLFAATYPDRVTALITLGGFPRRTKAPDYPWGPDKEEHEKFYEVTTAEWGGPVGIEARAASVSGDPACRQWWAKFLRLSGTKSSAVALLRANAEIDVRHVLPTIRVPTLVAFTSKDPLFPPAVGRYMASLIPNSKLLEIDSIDHLPFFDVADEVIQAIQTFLEGAPVERLVESSISTLMFTDIVGSTELAVSKGDRRYADILELHHSMVRRELVLHRGEEIETTGDGFLACFDGPARGIKCGRAVVRSLQTIGITTRVGLHTGECELRDGRLRGIALNIAARVMAAAPEGAVVVSQTVKDLVAGSGLKFIDKGPHSLKGLPDQWRLFELDSSP